MTKFRVSKSLGMILMGIWLILTGLIPILKLSMEGLPMIMQVLAIVAGALILFGL